MGHVSLIINSMYQFFNVSTIQCFNKFNALSYSSDMARLSSGIQLNKHINSLTINAHHIQSNLNYVFSTMNRCFVFLRWVFAQREASVWLKKKYRWLRWTFSSNGLLTLLLTNPYECIKSNNKHWQCREQWISHTINETIWRYFSLMSLSMAHRTKGVRHKNYWFTIDSAVIKRNGLCFAHTFELCY